PDPKKEADLEQIRQRALMKEFQQYLDTKGKLKLVRSEALRAGYKECWQRKDFTTIVQMAKTCTRGRDSGGPGAPDVLAPRGGRGSVPAQRLPPTLADQPRLDRTAAAHFVDAERSKERESPGYSWPPGKPA